MPVTYSGRHFLYQLTFILGKIESLKIHSSNPKTPRMKKTMWITPLLLLFWSCEQRKPVFTLDYNGIPVLVPSSFTNDYISKVLDSTQLDNLSKKLKKYEDSTKIKILISIIPQIPKDSEEDIWDPAELGRATFKKWDTDSNCVLIFMSLRNEYVQIESDSSISRELSSNSVKQSIVINEDLRNTLKEGNYDKVIITLISDIDKAAHNTYRAEKFVEEKESFKFTAIVFAIAVFIAMLMFNVKKVKNET